MKENQKIDYKEHWNKVYSQSEIEKVGWYEESPEPSLDLIKKCNLNKDAVILDVGSGATTLIEELLNDCYNNIIATDISEVALSKAQERLKAEEIVYMVNRKRKEITIAVNKYLTLFI